MGIRCELVSRIRAGKCERRTLFSQSGIHSAGGVAIHESGDICQDSGHLRALHLDLFSARLNILILRTIVPVARVGRLERAGAGALAVSRDESSALYVHLHRDSRNSMLVDDFRSR